MISGPQALQSLTEALRDIRREEDDIARRLSRSGERLAKFREAEGDLYRQLALVRLEPDMQAALDSRISSAEHTAREALRTHAQAVGAAEAALRKADDDLAELAAARAQKLEMVDQSQAQLKALLSKIAAAIAHDPAYAAKRAQTNQLQSVAAEAMSKTEQAEADRDHKGRPYRNDPLFSYLWERGYGTKTYRANTLEQVLDGWVARLTGFAQARPNYAVLNEIPLRLREHAERQAADASLGEAELDTLETEAIDKAGGQPLREAIEAARQDIETIDNQIVAAEDHRDGLAKALRDLAQGKDPAFESAMQAFVQGLGQQDVQTLVAQAKQTPSERDDALLAQIEQVRVQMDEETAESAEHKERLKTLALRRRELEDIEYEFKKARYDDPRSTFRQDTLVGNVLNDFLRGGISAASYWDQWRKSQSWTPGTSDWGGGVGLPRNGRPSWPGENRFSWPESSFNGSDGHSNDWNIGSSWPKPDAGKWPRPSSMGNSGGFSRPRSGSAGSRKGGGFKTGGGF